MFPTKIQIVVTEQSSFLSIAYQYQYDINDIVESNVRWEEQAKYYNK